MLPSSDRVLLLAAWLVVNERLSSEPIVSLALHETSIILLFMLYFVS